MYCTMYMVHGAWYMVHGTWYMVHVLANSIIEIFPVSALEESCSLTPGPPLYGQGSDVSLHNECGWSWTTPTIIIPAQCSLKRYFARKWHNLKFAWCKKIKKRKEDKKKKEYHQVSLSTSFGFTDERITNCATGKQPLYEPLFLIFILFYNW